ncbi:Fructan beta-fructosidase [Allomuricauda ruestringensis DSM 13258]|uniref:Fructan beta-fructosidase n=1 Tax=Allomuricauda ruestringensis (strain DSM 13258 / CIP 107369 / LMG 19739 / B1) TaxID=886377 RepID=G2PKY1_ALLRU|nr:glycoside hydrolase family 32 protein [Allomuricauda ruestringensis]AEM69960.1 Fructan beta-fructosidase [Allomuricauda ruestringensis DSM 13258]
MFRLIISCMVVAALVSCKEKREEVPNQPQEESWYKEEYRPQFHFSPKEKWMNDPNGLVFNQGVYHLFYQYYPEDIVWGPMHWGHAVSEDLVHWKHKPIALYPDEHGYIFSGSAVVDKNNTSGFGENGEAPLVAIFTYHSKEGEEAGRMDFQTQGVAYSLDNGNTWNKYEGNPIIQNDGIKDFRDPKVFWHESSQSWILTLVAGDHAKFYTSKNLKDWTYLSDFGKSQGAHGGVWECPDLFPLQVDGSEEEKWVLIISINPGAPNGGSGTQYFVGDFDGKVFTSNQKEPKWLDYGTDNYAGVTYNNVPGNGRFFIGWMSNWNYAQDTPTKKWRSAMTVPRKLSLHKVVDDYFLANYPIDKISDLTNSTLVNEVEVAANTSDTLQVEGLNQSEIRLRTAAKNFKLLFKNELDEVLVLSMDSKNQVFTIDRTLSGKVDFQEDFGAKKHVAPLKGMKENVLEFKILMDWSSMELFVDQGMLSMTEQIFPTVPYHTLIIVNEDEQAPIVIKSIKRMESIW